MQWAFMGIHEPQRTWTFGLETTRNFEQAYGRRVTIEENHITFPVIGRDDLLRAKRAAGRQMDLQDVVSLEKVGARE